MVLARAPRNQVRNRDAYEFLAGIGTGGEQTWSKEIGQTLPGRDARFSGGFGIYDAPQPWGPWTTVYYTEQWDVGPGDTCSFPTKWMSEDGKTAYLVFSGEDSFSVRKATFATNGGSTDELKPERSQLTAVKSGDTIVIA
jgi:hypothetical protein